MVPIAAVRCASVLTRMSDELLLMTSCWKISLMAHNSFLFKIMHGAQKWNQSEGNTVFKIAHFRFLPFVKPSAYASPEGLATRDFGEL